MTIPTNAVQLLESRVMDDVPEGGGGPTGTVIPYGAHNHIFTDVTTIDRAGGDLSIRQCFWHLQTDDTERALDMHQLIARLPEDPNITVSMVECDTFATRTEIARAIASYYVPASEMSGYLLEDHVKNQPSIVVFMRPGTPLPTRGQTLFLIYRENQPDQRYQAVRVTGVESMLTTYTYTTGGSAVDFVANRVTLSLDKPLSVAFPGSPPSRMFARDATKTVIRTSMAAAATRVYGATRLKASTALTDTSIKVDSIFAQLVPSSYTPRAIADELPGAIRTIVLATGPRRVEVGVTPHTYRIKITPENVSTTLSGILPINPEPGTVMAVYRSVGQKYFVPDDGAGRFIGAAGETGTVDSATRSWTLNMAALPDVGSIVTIHYGTRVSYTNRSAQGAAVRRPEYPFLLEGDTEDDQIIPSSLTIRYTSGGTVYTITDNGTGDLVEGGQPAGVVDYPSRNLLIRPRHMPDPGAEFEITCDFDNTVTEILTPTTPDGGGYITLSLAQQPAAKSLQIQWAVARTVSNTSGGSLTTTEASKTAGVSYTTRTVPEYYEPGKGEVIGSDAGVNWATGKEPIAYRSDF